jgi:uncharacterized protein (DUF488 family)
VNYTTHASLIPIESTFKEADSLIKYFKAFILLLYAPYILLGKYIYKLFINDGKAVSLEEKEKILQEALKKQNIIIKILKEKEKISEENLSKLLKTNEQLMEIIAKLESDIETMKSEGLH